MCFYQERKKIERDEAERLESDLAKKIVWASKKANPKVEIRDETNVFGMITEEIHQSSERSRLWDLAVAAYPPYHDYQNKTDRLIPLFLAKPIS